MNLQSIPRAHYAAIFPRTTTIVLGELLCVRADLARLQHDTRDREPTAWEDARWTTAERDIEALQDELRALVERTTGEPWDALLKALS